MKPLCLCLLILLFSCRSSNEYYNHGDYYSAVIKSVNKLKQFPKHTKSREILQKAYPLALQTLETKSSNLMASDDMFKYRNTLVVYGQINAMYELIQSTPAALEIIPDPKNYFRQIGELRAKAADETYQAGIQSMMGGTRGDSRTAYQYFAETRANVPDYKEVIEMMTRSKEEGTLRMVWEEENSGYWWSSSKIISAIEALPFVELQPMADYLISDDSKKKHIELEMKISNSRYSDDSPTVTSSSYEIVDSVKTGEKIVKGKVIPIKEAIKGTYITYEKSVTSHGSVTVTIVDRKTRATIFSRQYEGNGRWKGTWNECKGDKRVFKGGQDCISFEPNANYSSLLDQVRDQINQEATRTLTNLLTDY